MHRKNARLFPRVPAGQIVAFLVMLAMATVLLSLLSALGSPAAASTTGQQGQAWVGQVSQAVLNATPGR